MSPDLSHDARPSQFWYSGIQIATDLARIPEPDCFQDACSAQHKADKAETNVRFLGDLILAGYRRDLQLSVLEELVGEINVHETGESSV